MKITANKLFCEFEELEAFITDSKSYLSTILLSIFLFFSFLHFAVCAFSVTLE